MKRRKTDKFIGFIQEWKQLLAVIVVVISCVSGTIAYIHSIQANVPKFFGLTPGLGARVERVENDLTNIQMSQMRVELMLLIKNFPENRQGIHELYDLYLKNHGNHYITSLYEEWRALYDNSKIHK